MSNPVLSQLAAVEDDLSQQVESLEYKLTALQEQREGLRTVINMFQGSSQSSTRKVAASPSSVSAAVADSTADSMADSTAAATTGKAATRKASANKPASSKKTGKKVSRSTGRQSAQSETVKATKPKAAAPKTSTPKTSTPKTSADKKLALQKKKDGRAADWQKHVQADYLEAALPEAVSIVLRSQPSEIFTIADVMSSIFTEDMPRASYLKARNRISNILSAGARDGTWYRGRNGRYSQSENVKKIK
jgi:hypothetical protein